MSTKKSTRDPRWNWGKGRLILIGLLSFLLPAYLSAQSTAVHQSTPIQWHLDATVQGVQFYHALTSCNGNNVVLLKFNNSNNYSVKLSWKEVFTTQFGKKDGAAGQREMVIPTGVSVPSGCTDQQNRRNIILPGDVNPAFMADISAFEFSGISVNKIN